MSILKQFSEDTIVYGLGRSIKKFIGLLLLPIYTRALSPADYGILDTLGAGLFFVSTFFNFGLDTASSYFFFKPQDEKEKGKILFTVFVIRLLVIIPALMLSFFSGPVSSALFGSDAYSNVILITCLLIPVNMLMSEQELIYRFYRNIWGYNALTIVKSLVNIFAGILLVIHFKLGVYGAQIASLVSTVVVVLVSLLFYTRKKYFYRFSFSWAGKMIRFGFPLIWAGMAVWIYSVSDRFLLLKFRDTTEIGYYSIGNTFTQPLGMINMAIQMSFGILFWATFHKETDPEKTKSKKAISDVVILYVVIAGAVTLFLSIFSGEMVRYITTPEYLKGIVVIPVLLMCSIYAQLVEIIPVGISISEKTYHYTWIIIVAALANLLINLFVIPVWGFFGAALTTLLAYLLYYGLSDWVSSRFLNSSYPRLRVNTYLTVIFVISLFFPFMEIYNNHKYSLIIKILVFTSSFSLPFIFQFITGKQTFSLAAKLLSLPGRFMNNKN
jgi:O-antigen/teichoic acid export membrane protein